MIEQETVLVLGAGASAPYGLPTGLQLRRKILAEPAATFSRIATGSGSATITHGLGESFVEAFRGSELNSIDAFIEHRPEFEEVGRNAIARILLPLEDPNTLFEELCEDHWYRYLLEAMRAPSLDRFLENRVSFITFNYDRSLERYLQHTVRHRYSLNEEAACEAVAKLRVIHVYGHLGSLDRKRPGYVPYGCDGGDYKSYQHAAAAGLRLIGAGRDDSAEFTAARALIQREAVALCFLGFGFDEVNVRRLGGTDVRAARGHFAASGLWLKDAERRHIATLITDVQHRRGARGCIHDAKCTETLRLSMILRGRTSGS